MSEPSWSTSINVEELSSNYRGDLDPEKIVWMQIQRCNVLHSQGDETLYGNAVMSLLINVPQDIWEEVEAQEHLYHIKEKQWKPALIDGEYYSSDPDNPDIINKRGGLHYNPSFRGRRYEKVVTKTKDSENNDIEETEIKEVYEVGGPHQISPIYLEAEQWDYYVLQKLIMAALQIHGLTWKQDRIEMATGEEWNDSFNPPSDDDVKIEVDELERQQPTPN